MWRSPGGAGARIELFDVGGRRVREIPLPAAPDGVTEWNGRDHDGNLVPAGIYLARLISGSFHAQARVVLLP
jgi:flagellar hook assembly protein FlgD